MLAYCQIRCIRQAFILDTSPRIHLAFRVRLTTRHFLAERIFVYARALLLFFSTSNQLTISVRKEIFLFLLLNLLLTDLFYALFCLELFSFFLDHFFSLYLLHTFICLDLFNLCTSFSFSTFTELISISLLSYIALSLG